MTSHFPRRQKCHLTFPFLQKCRLTFPFFQKCEYHENAQKEGCLGFSQTYNNCGRRTFSILINKFKNFHLMKSHYQDKGYAGHKKTHNGCNLLVALCCVGTVAARLKFPLTETNGPGRQCMSHSRLVSTLQLLLYL